MLKLQQFVNYLWTNKWAIVFLVVGSAILEWVPLFIIGFILVVGTAKGLLEIAVQRMMN